MNFAPVAISVAAIKLNAIDHASVLNFGTAQHIDIAVAYKRNQGLGEQNGDLSPIVLPISAVSDCDLNDSNAIKASVL